jgi:hypothetical protein
MPRIRSIVMVLAAMTLLSQQAVGADENALTDGLIPDGERGYTGFSNDRDAEPGDHREDRAIDRSLHDPTERFRFDPYDTGYDDPLCNPDFRDYSPSDCPWRQ